jgi:hypothetical protein
MGVRELKAEVSSKCKALRGILAFTFQLDREWNQRLGEIGAHLQAATARELRSFRDMLEKQLRHYLRVSGCKVGPAWFKTWIEGWEADIERPGTPRQPKWLIDMLFRNIHRVVPGWESFPAHASFFVDPSGQLYGRGQVEYYLAEAALYEDMCFAYNHAVDAAKSSSSGSSANVEKKSRDFYVRTAVLSAFYFVEAYLNGIAFDFTLRCRSDLPQEVQDELYEYDSKNKREKWLSLRRKMLQYPKIILDLRDPPLVETNCEEMRTLLAEAKTFRDSIVHQSPRPDFESEEFTKLWAFGKLRLADASRIVDAAVTYVNRVNAMLGDQGADLTWLYKRDETGRFPEKAFE